jgi:hypothetical protein
MTDLEFNEQKQWVERQQAAFSSWCPKCQGTREIMKPTVPGYPDMHMACTYCDMSTPLWRVADLYWANVPAAYRFVTLSTLQPSEKSRLPLGRQQAIISAVKADPESGYAFFGPPGIGKSVWTTALYGRALWRQVKSHERSKYFPVWRISAKQMLDEHTEYAMGQFEDEIDRVLGQPTVTVEKIKHIRGAQHQVPRLFLEEIDKVKETETRRNNLFEILDALQAAEGQLVLNSNLSYPEFVERMGPDMQWRIEKMAKIVSLF